MRNEHRLKFEIRRYNTSWKTSIQKAFPSGMQELLISFTVAKVSVTHWCNTIFQTNVEDVDQAVHFLGTLTRIVCAKHQRVSLYPYCLVISFYPSLSCKIPLTEFTQRRCVDAYNTAECIKLADKLECHRNASFMTAFCLKTCNFCFVEDVSTIKKLPTVE